MNGPQTPSKAVPDSPLETARRGQSYRKDESSHAPVPLPTGLPVSSGIPTIIKSLPDAPPPSIKTMATASSVTVNDENLPPRQRVHSKPTTPLKRSASSFGASLQALRKKIGSEINKKRPGMSTSSASERKRQAAAVAASKAGSVAGLRPAAALTVPESMTISEAAQLCAAKRADCVLVVDEDESLSGIFTAKDLAYRVVAQGLDPRNTTVNSIMTKNPMVTRDSSSATEALQVMVTKGFRHLPVCNDMGDVSGLLDITKVFHDALDKVERSHGASQKLYNAMEGVQSELGGSHAQNPQAAAMFSYVNALREKMALPDLASIMDINTAPATVGVKTTVREAAKIMMDCHTTAVCVMEQPGVPTSKIAGIFTSKDVVLRVIAAGLDPSRCAVVRVMTPHPDVGSPSMTIQEALKKMHTGHYLNLPVVDESKCLVGIVDVLKLTYATLEQINSLNSADDAANEGESGPMWSRFFNSIQQPGGANSANGGDMDSESVVSGNQDSVARTDLQPGDSASAVGASNTNHPSTIGTGMQLEASLPIDDGTYVFKFNSPSGMTHRFQARHDSLDLLRDIVSGKLSVDPFFKGSSQSHEDFTLAYTDRDSDIVQMSADSDVKDSVLVARGRKEDRVVLVLQGNWTKEETAPVPVPVAAPAPTPIFHNPPPIVQDIKRKVAKKDFDIKEFLLPISIGAAGVCVLLGVLLSRSKK